jgi:hydrogenase expression/formation protein HypD
MKYVDEYRDGDVARAIAKAIAHEARPERAYRFMEFCGGHTHAISRYGIEDLLPANVEMIHGPGCPVCVLPMGRVDDAIQLVQNPEITLCIYGDLMRVPGSNRSSLLKAKADGADIRMVYSSADAVQIAQAEPARQVVFFAIGFETTTPATAMALRLAEKAGLRNFTIFCNHVLTPSAIAAILESGKVGDRLSGFVGPAHVSTIIGTGPYERFAQDYRKPITVAGFEPLDVLQAILMLVRQVNEGSHVVENQYIRAVTRDGNRKAQAQIESVFDKRDSFEWRGLGHIPHSALQLRPAFAGFDAELRFGIKTQPAADHKACECGTILRGLKKPADCKLFGTACTPETPMGSCMVSSEGACAAYWSYGRFRHRAAAEPERLAS